MFGFADVWVWLAYFLSIAAMLLCVVYGIMRWNQDDEELPKPVHPQDENLEFEETL